METQDVPMDGVVLLPPLPQPVWDTIVQLIFQPTYELLDALIQIKNLSLVNSSLRRACKNAVLRLDASRSLDAHVAALSKLPIAVEYLDLDDYYNREFVLRSATFIKHSALTLKHVSAPVRCTDTLAKFPLLHSLKLHGQESFPTLYPAVLSHVNSLKHLELINYELNIVTDEIPLDILTGLETLTIRPRPDGRKYHLHGLEFGRPLKLKHLKLEGTVDNIQAANFAPCPEFQLPVLLAAAENIVVEAGSMTLMWHPRFGDVPDTSEELFRWAPYQLLHAPKTFKRIEFRLLDSDGIQVGDSVDLRILARIGVIRLTDALEEQAPGGVLGDMRWSYGVETQSIFEVYCVRVWREPLSETC